ncbi:hypothetical protein NCG97_09770 [Streptomyces lydicamycinicus]|uniref:hypothetical protein n=1 Tax=Streptomyces lydicamycinicus TaxID=1546107 RepID=UPI0020362CCE|nr:hypothetical protein [Streptomyces lydicamycinicus]USA00926.1 hypothetical protein NCG97_09770 [Streptomyces lydicamycinicus]
MKMLPVFEEVEAESQGLFQRASLSQLAGRLAPAIREPLAMYLSGAYSLLAAGNIQDPINPGKGVVVPFGYCTDGEWVWPSYWGYFVREYGVQLPDEFIDHVQGRNFAPAVLSDEELDKAEEEFEEQFFD